MKLQFGAALALSWAASLASADSSPSVLTIPIQKTYTGADSAPSVLKMYAAASQAALTRWSNSYSASRSFAATDSISPNALVDLGDSAYLGPVAIGTPAQLFFVDFDTGSNRLWVRGSQCRACIYPGGSPAYNPLLSSTAQVTNMGEGQLYGLGSENGTLVYDNVQFGGYTSTAQIFSDVFQVDQTFQQQIQGGMDGIAGLAFNERATTSSANYIYETVVQGLIRRGAIKSPMFAMWLNGSSSGNVQYPGGEFTLGGYNTQRFQGSITWLPIDYIPGTTSRYFWAHNLTSIKVGSTSINTNQVGILDTGTSLLVIDQASFTNVIQPGLGINITTQVFQGQSLFVVNCQDVKPTLPDIVIYLQGNPFPVSYQQYIAYDPVNKICILALQVAADLPGWILGDIFLRQYYSIFDHGSARSGLAPVAGNSLPIQPPGLPTTPIQPNSNNGNNKDPNSKSGALGSQASLGGALLGAVVAAFFL
ncbi:aspartic peptidase domain-containing protein [Polychytrium aggregatum]|uniref:aspartic peptidase domain-containing protein n=1 Tax=Polychytrium aggregatum TaxID=110093 RepID=UPI0022FE3764|nr:aspartic peptidase domain-containing protein [Polychytrium aggregatum]KAI9202558.1 aspartic peptidase domain-containing protein [Polychytrium aggregatum]